MFDEDTVKMECVYGALSLDSPPDVANAMSAEGTASFLTADTVERARIVVPAPVRAGGLRDVLKPDAVPRAIAAADRVALSSIELHVLAYIDGRRPVARLRTKTGLATDDLHVALALLASKGVIVLGGVVQRVDDVDELDRDTVDLQPAVRPAARPLARGARDAVVAHAPPRAE